MQSLEKDQNANLLGESSTELQDTNTAKLSQFSSSQHKTSNKQQTQILDPIEELLKNNNIMPLIAVIDKVDLNRKIQQKPIISIMATKFIPLPQILKDRQITFPTDVDKRTPLHYAIQANDIKAAAWLIEKGNPNTQDNFGNTPILDAIRLGRRRCFLICLKNKLYDQRAPILAAMHNRHWQLKTLYGLKQDIFDYRDQQHKNSFQRALQYCSFDCAQFMMKVDPQRDIKKVKHMTQSKGLITRLQRIKKQQSTQTSTRQFINPLILLSVISVGILSDSLNHEGSSPYQSKTPFYFLIILLILTLNIMMCIFGSLCKGNVQNLQKNTLSQILNEPNYQTLEDICPICVHYTNYRFEHCYKCGCCVQKYHFHSFVCVNKSNQVFWISSQYIWLYLVGSLLSVFNQYISYNSVNIALFSSYNPIKYLATIQYLIQNGKYTSIAWLIFIGFLYLYQLLYCFLLFGMMCMRRKYPQVINSQKYLHLYKVVKSQDNYILQEQKIFQRGFLAGLARCARNFLVYFFVED